MAKNKSEIHFSTENADAFFRQIDRWNDADRYVDCIRLLDEARENAGETYKYRIACLYARACYNEVYFGDDFPDEQKTLLAALSINALEDVWDEGIDDPKWNMFIAYAYEYIENFPLAVRHAKRWLKLDPDNENAENAVNSLIEKLEQSQTETDDDDDDNDDDDDSYNDDETDGNDNISILDAKVLLTDPYFDKDSFLRALKRNWGIGEKTDDDTDENLLMLSLPGCNAAIRFIDHMLPNETAKFAELAARHNDLWQDAVKAAESYRCYIEVGVISLGAPLIECKEMLIKLLSIFCWYENVCGIYSNYVLYEPAWYRKEAEKFRGDGMSSLLLVWVHAEEDDGFVSAYTCGMDDFNRDELEIIHSNAPVDEVRGFLARFAAGSLYGDPLEEGSYTLSGKKYTVTRGKSVLAYEDMSLKVSYP